MQDEDYALTLQEAEILIIMHAVSEFYKLIGDDDINDHRCSVLLNAFRKMKQSMIDKDLGGNFLSFDAILLAQDNRIKQ